MLVHRIAHPLVKCAEAGTPVGPYNAYSVAASQGMDPGLVMSLREVADFLCSRLDSSHTPPPSVEGHFILAGREQSAFISEAQAQSWFRDGVEKMREAGFCWLTYEINERYVRSTHTQAIALLRRARLVTISEIPFSSEPDYYYCTYCGYSDGCDCWTDCAECGSVYALCFCSVEDDLTCGGCGEQYWSCRC